MPKYELPQVDGFSEEQVMSELEAQGKLGEYAVPQEPAPVEATPVESEPAPVPPQEDVTDEAEEGSPLPKTIPYERFAEAQRKAREREAEYQKQLDEFRRQQAELLKEQQAFLRKQMEERAPKPEPVEEDPLKVLIRTEAEEMVRPLKQQLEAKERAQALQARIEQAEAEVERIFPDYKEVAGPVQARMAQAVQAANAGDQDAAKWLQSILMDENPPLKAYMLGRWEKARQQASPTQSPTLAQPPAAPQAPMRGNPPVLPRGTQVQGSNTPDVNADLSKVVNMDLKEFTAWRQKNPALAKKWMKGEI